MKFELEIGDRLRTVEIQRRGAGFRVLVDGKERLVDAAHVAPTSWSILLQTPDGSGRRSIEAAVVPQPTNGGFDVHLDGFTIPVQLKSGLGRRSRDAGAGGRGTGPQHINAPMPGKVVRILVKPGDQVQARQGLVVVEAMKMENELRAARDGQVTQVTVVEGQSVEAGAALLVVE